MSQEHLNVSNPWENEELTEAELDALAGGRTLNPLAITDTALFSNDLTITRPSDNIFTAVGAQGTGDLSLVTSPPMNLSLAFP